jgi:hypothetical protein
MVIYKLTDPRMVLESDLVDMSMFEPLHPVDPLLVGSDSEQVLVSPLFLLLLVHFQIHVLQGTRGQVSYSTIHTEQVLGAYDVQLQVLALLYVDYLLDGAELIFHQHWLHQVLARPDVTIHTLPLGIGEQVLPFLVILVHARDKHIDPLQCLTLLVLNQNLQLAQLDHLDCQMHIEGILGL